MTNIQLPSGLFDNNVELFSHNGAPMALHHGEIKSVFDLPKNILDLIYEDMYANEKAVDALELANYNTSAEMLAKYVTCRFGELDNLPDVFNKKIQSPEIISCPVRGTCKMEGIVCSLPTVNGYKITSFEMRIISELATEKILPVIAEDLNVSINTLELRKKLLFQKFKVYSRARLVAVTFSLHIIKTINL